MANELRRKLLTAKTIKNGGDAGITLASLGAGAWRQFVKLDLGYASPYPLEIEVRIAAKPTSAPTAGGAVRLFFGFSSSATAGTGNPANLSGADAAYVGYGAAAGDADECISQLHEAGQGLVASADAVIQTSEWLGPFTVRDRYLVGAVKNGLSVDLSATETDHEITVRVWTLEIQ